MRALTRPFALLTAFLLALAWSPAGAAAAEDLIPARVNKHASGLPVPRFVALRADKVNLRTGPGLRYPIKWVFLRVNLPVEVIEEYDSWRHIRDSSGAEGWVLQTMLTSRRHVIVTGSERVLRSGPSEQSDAVARLLPGVVAALKGCRPHWCEIETQDVEGWLPEGTFWGVLPKDFHH